MRLERTGELRDAVAVYASVLARSIETAQILSASLGSGDLVPERRCELCEVHWGEADGMSEETYRLRWPHPGVVAAPDLPVAPGGESWTTFLKRARPAIRQLVDIHHDQTVVVSGHVGIVNAALIELAHLPPTTRLLANPPNASLSIWDRRGGSRGGDWELVTLGDASHVAPAISTGGESLVPQGGSAG